MNRDFASSLIQLNNTFYREHSASFSDTRQAPWPGWVRTMDIALEQLDVATIEHPVRVFDLACGNMRFENFAAGGALSAKGEVRFQAVIRVASSWRTQKDSLYRRY